MYIYIYTYVYGLSSMDKHIFPTRLKHFGILPISVWNSILWKSKPLLRSFETGRMLEAQNLAQSWQQKCQRLPTALAGVCAAFAFNILENWMCLSRSLAYDWPRLIKHL